MFGTVLLVIGLASVVHSDEAPMICTSPISDPQSIPSTQIHVNLQVFGGSFAKNTPYDGKLRF